jgi:glycosyltransferase involved in cell wall biosynthesis
MLSIVIPVYKNEESLDRLLPALERVTAACLEPVEVVLVVDGSPDRCTEILRERLPHAAFASRLVMLSRNFGSFNAIRAGLDVGQGDTFAVLAADLQEPPELALRFHEILSNGDVDIAFGVRASRSDPWASEAASRLFWAIYRRLVLPELPPGGVDMFGCTRAVRDRLVELREPNSNLIALLFWLGFRRAYVPYERQPRREGTSAWTLGKKLRYCFDSVFNFTDLPIRLLLGVGVVGTLTAVVYAIVLLTARLTGRVEVPGYTAIALAVTFFGSITSLGLGILGQYLWLVLQNTRGRPGYLIERVEEFHVVHAHRDVPGDARAVAREASARASRVAAASTRGGPSAGESR